METPAVAEDEPMADALIPTDENINADEPTVTAVPRNQHHQQLAQG